MVRVSLSPGEWIHLSLVGHRRMVWKGTAPRLAEGHASAWNSPFSRSPAPGAQRYQAAETEAETAAEEAWCPPMPDAPDDPTESEIAGAADKLETMLRGSHPSVNIFFQPDNLGALPALWLQAKLTIHLREICQVVYDACCTPHTGFGRYCPS